MPRIARRVSESSIYHVIQRGAGQQILFEDDADREFYLALVERFLEESPEPKAVLAWCLMSNHVHLLLQMEIDELSRFMKRLGTAYAHYFNKRHSRAGHLFQDRFKSEPIDSEEYLVTVVRYIHLNPVGVECDEPGDYRWSSYGEYADARGTGLTSTDLVLGAFGGKRQFKAFHRAEPTGKRPLEAHSVSTRPADDQKALELAKEVLGDVGIHELKSMRKDERDRYIVALRDRGLSVRQISRIAGIGTNIVARAKSGE